MMRVLLVTIALLAGLVPVVGHGTPLPPFPAPTKNDRLVVVAPHPDDEAIAAGGLIQQTVAAGGKVRVIYLTNGDHNQFAFKLYSRRLHLGAKDYLHFGEVRRVEAIAATKQLGLRPEDLVFLGYPDWGSLRVWRDYWETGEVFTSDSTRTNAVPYSEDYRPGNLYRPQNILQDLSGALRDFKPTKVVAAHPCDTNPDHRAVANFTRLALLQLADEGIRPELYFFIVHFGRWPRPLRYHPDVLLTPPVGLLDDGQWMSLPVSMKQAEIKHRAILENRTQIKSAPNALPAFARANELFAREPAEIVPVLEENAEIDWRLALRARSLAILPPEVSRHVNGNGGSSPAPAMPLDKVDFLRQGDDLLVLVQLRNWIGKRTGVQVHLFGYQRGTDFSKLPKVRMNVSVFGNLTVTASDKRVAEHGVTLSSNRGRLLFRVPFKLLGGNQIDHIFASARAHFGEIAADDSAWQLLAIQPNKQNRIP